MTKICPFFDCCWKVLWCLCTVHWLITCKGMSCDNTFVLLL
jgi:hypothetical protein